MPSGVGSTYLEFTCPLSAGMHARPASQLAEVANKFASDLLLTNLRNRREANAKSVLSVIAADIRHGDPCSVQVQGVDEQAAQSALRTFLDEVLPISDVPLAEPSLPSVPRVLQAAGVSCWVGSPASPGLARGNVVIASAFSLPRSESLPPALSPEEELARLERAFTAVRNRLRQKLSDSDAEPDAVLKADLAMADDVLLAQRIVELVARGKSAGSAVVETGEHFVELLRHSESEYIRERAVDLEEILVQLLDELYGADRPRATPDLDQPSVLVAETMGPQQLLAFDRRWLKALVLEHAGINSHALILARSHGIPAVVGVRNARRLFSAGTEVLVDANRGLVASLDSPAAQKFFQREGETLTREKRLQQTHAGMPAMTTDGREFLVAGNASSEEELRLALAEGADGIGLFRTEMSFLRSPAPPSEEVQFAQYAQAARLFAERHLVIRTLDLGGDKPAPYLKFPREANPFLGYRGVRVYAEHAELLRIQLRAILRASVYGHIQIMVPMISSLGELLRFKAELDRVKKDLERERIAFRQDTEIGIMIEVPSVAFTLDQLSTEVDFFSIGTNDLAQYFFAVDRDNIKLSGLCNVQDPGFLRLLKKIVDEAHTAGKWIAMCGNMASERRYLPLLLGLGLDEISIPAAQIPHLKRAIRQYSAVQCRALFDQATACREVAEVDDLLARFQPSPAHQPLLSEELIVLDSDSSNKEEAMQELIDRFYIAERTQDRGQLEQALWAREEVYSTDAAGFGFATPHCKSRAVALNSIGVLRFRTPIHWGPVDGQPVRMAVCMAMREEASAHDHLQIFSRLAAKLMNEEFRAQMLAIEDTAQMVNYLGEQLEIPLA